MRLFGFSKLDKKESEKLDDSNEERSLWQDRIRTPGAV